MGWNDAWNLLNGDILSKQNKLFHFKVFDFCLPCFLRFLQLFDFSLRPFALQEFSTISGFGTIFVKLSALVIPSFRWLSWYSFRGEFSCHVCQLPSEFFCYPITFKIWLHSDQKFFFHSYARDRNVFYFYFFMHIIIFSRSFCNFDDGYNSVHPLVDVPVHELFICLHCAMGFDLRENSLTIPNGNYCFQSNERRFENFQATHMGIHTDHILLMLLLFI